MVVRKTGLIILTLLYLAFTAGITVQRHYCMNRMATLRFTAKPEDRCGFCGMEKTGQDNSCCRDEQAVYKITDDQQPGFPTQLTLTELPAQTPDYYIPVTGTLPSITVFVPVYNHGPPGIAAIPLFIRFGVFRI